MFGSDMFPLGPNGQFPKQRIRSFGNPLVPGVSAQESYLSGINTVSKPTNMEKNFASSNNKVKDRFKQGMVLRSHVRGIDRFRPRYAPKFSLRHAGLGDYAFEFERGMDVDPVYDASGNMVDEGMTDDSVGFYRGARTTGRFLPFTALFKRGVARRR